MTAANADIGAFEFVEAIFGDGFNPLVEPGRRRRRIDWPGRYDAGDTTVIRSGLK